MRAARYTGAFTRASTRTGKHDGLGENQDGLCQGRAELPALSREFAAPYSTIQRRGIKEDWPGQREEYLEENVGEKMKQVKTKLLRRIERTLDEDRELDSKDFKAMTGALKELREIQDEAETARVNEPLTVRFVGKAEELSM